MAGYFEAAPLLAGGPWGVVAWAVVGTVLTVATVVGVVELEKAVTKSRSEPRAIPRAIPKTAERTPCQRPYSVRIHAQGTDMGGTTGSTIGLAIPPQCTPVTVAQGSALSAAVQAMLTKRQLAVRVQAIARAEKYIVSAPPAGVLGQKSFEVPGVRGGLRYDVDSYGPSPNFIE